MSMNMNHLNFVKTVLTNDAKVISEKESTYKGSWKKRGGVGAFMMLARKWDRMENIAFEEGFDVFKVCEQEDFSTDDGSMIEQIADLRRYLTLIEAEILSKKFSQEANPYLLDSTESSANLIESVDDDGKPLAHWERPEECSEMIHKELRTSKHYNLVVDFMLKAGQEVPSNVQHSLSEDVAILRAKLILEETLEKINALGVSVVSLDSNREITSKKQKFGFDFDSRKQDIIEVLDACADVSVVNLGTLASLGFPDEALLELIDLSNLSKFRHEYCKECGSEETEGFLNAEGLGCRQCSKCNSNWPCHFRNDEGKLIKPFDWRKPRIEELAGKVKKLNNV